MAVIAAALISAITWPLYGQAAFVTLGGDPRPGGRGHGRAG